MSVGLPKGSVRLVAHDPSWRGSFEAERALLEAAMLGLVADIQHIGSTAIPGLAAKPVIDMLVGLESMGSVAAAVEALVAVGYEDRGVPEPGRRHLAKGGPELRTHYLHVVEHGSPQWWEKVLFRDYLLQHPRRRVEYERLKQRLASSHAGDRADYTRAKQGFVRETVALAKSSPP